MNISINHSIGQLFYKKNACIISSNCDENFMAFIQYNFTFDDMSIGAIHISALYNV